MNREQTQKPARKVELHNWETYAPKLQDQFIKEDRTAQKNPTQCILIRAEVELIYLRKKINIYGILWTATKYFQ